MCPLCSENISSEIHQSIPVRMVGFILFGYINLMIICFRLFLAEYNRLLSTGGDPKNLKMSLFSSDPGLWEAETEGIPSEGDPTDDENIVSNIAYGVEKEAGDNIVIEEDINKEKPENQSVSDHVEVVDVSSDTEVEVLHSDHVEVVEVSSDTEVEVLHPSGSPHRYVCLPWGHTSITSDYKEYTCR